MTGNDVGAGGATTAGAGPDNELLAVWQQVFGHGLPQGLQHLSFLNEPQAFLKPENNGGQHSLHDDFGTEHWSHF